MPEHMTTKEATRLERLELRIQACVDSITDAGVELGGLLAEISADRLYKFVYKSFESYCWARWKLGRHRAYQLIGAHETAQFLLTNGQQLLPANERQYRSLGKLPLEERLLVWQHAVEDADCEQPAAAAIAALIADRMARQTDEEQLAFVEGYEKGLGGPTPGHKEANPVSTVERWRGKLHKQVAQYPDAAPEGRALELAIDVYLAKLRHLAS